MNCTVYTVPFKCKLVKLSMYKIVLLPMINSSLLYYNTFSDGVGDSTNESETDGQHVPSGLSLMQQKMVELAELGNAIQKEIYVAAESSDPVKLARTREKAQEFLNWIQRSNRADN